jgi:hypothetical protein
VITLDMYKHNKHGSTTYNKYQQHLMLEIINFIILARNDKLI